jgi:hypothetical protein
VHEKGKPLMTRLLVVDEIVEKAKQDTSLDHFDSESFIEGLEILTTDINNDDRGDAIVERMFADFVTALATRLRVVKYLDDHPELKSRPIEKPVFVFGVPRTGTTLMSNLLAADPARRSPLTWEIDEPVPPATPETLYTDPRALSRLESEKAMLAANPDFGKYYRGSAIYPNEDVFIMAHDFKTLMWESRGKLPQYREWIFSTDVTSAYEYHRLFLQVLGSKAPGPWNLKMPSHALYLETLLKVYPDARLIWTHRDPITATGSFCSLITLGHRGFTADHQPDIPWIRENQPWQAQLHADRIMDARAVIGHDRIQDVHYAELLREPIATMKRLYAALGDEFTPEAEAGMRSWLADNPQNKFGKHEYKLAQYGLTPEELRERFARYLSEYDVEPEG